jgi:methionine-S-sulfoxide reductase
MNEHGKKSLQTATFAGGCFWCMQPPFDAEPGVESTEVGYMGGNKPDPTYEEVCSGMTGHAEVIQIRFDPERVSYATLLDIFWRNIDPTAMERQFADRGTQYRTAIFYHSEEQKRQAFESRLKLEQSEKFDQPVVTEIVAATEFYPAENYHQEYYRKHPGRYRLYKEGSGRAGYIRKVWGEEAEKAGQR